MILRRPPGIFCENSAGYARRLLLRDAPLSQRSSSAGLDGLGTV